MVSFSRKNSYVIIILRPVVHMSILVRLDAEVESRSLLKHPFYRAWSEGGLTRQNLSGYAMEYFQLVKAVPGLVAGVASLATPADAPAIRENVAEETTHVEPWIRFAGALGVKENVLRSYEGARATLESVEELRNLVASSFDEGVAAMYAYECQLPMISRSKIDGLKKHYGLIGGDATRYFELHEEADVRHAALWRRYLSRPSVSEGAAMTAVALSLKAQNGLLDSVMANHCQ
jgi:pyrroloquinoline-quinone synthase